MLCTYHVLTIADGGCFSVSLATLTFDHSDSASFSHTANCGGQQRRYKNNLSVFPALMRMASVAVVTLIDSVDPWWNPIDWTWWAVRGSNQCMWVHRLILFAYSYQTVVCGRPTDGLCFGLECIVRMEKNGRKKWENQTNKRTEKKPNTHARTAHVYTASCHICQFCCYNVTVCGCVCVCV